MEHLADYAPSEALTQNHTMHTRFHSNHWSPSPSSPLPIRWGEGQDGRGPRRVLFLCGRAVLNAGLLRLLNLLSEAVSPARSPSQMQQHNQSTR
jgi:hypothetical protein